MMIKAEAHEDGEGYWVEFVHLDSAGERLRGIKITMLEAEALKYQLESILYEYDCMVDANTNRNYPEDP